MLAIEITAHQDATITPPRNATPGWIRFHRPTRQLIIQPPGGTCVRSAALGVSLHMDHRRHIIALAAAHDLELIVGQIIIEQTSGTSWKVAFDIPREYHVRRQRTREDTSVSHRG